MQMCRIILIGRGISALAWWPRHAQFTISICIVIFNFLCMPKACHEAMLILLGRDVASPHISFSLSPCTCLQRSVGVTWPRNVHYNIRYFYFSILLIMKMFWRMINDFYKRDSLISLWLNVNMPCMYLLYYYYASLMDKKRSPWWIANRKQFLDSFFINMKFTVIPSEYGLLNSFRIHANVIFIWSHFDVILSIIMNVIIFI